jgi:MFS family permease
MFSMFFFATLYVQEILGYTPIQAGFAFLPVTFGIGIGAGLAQQGIKRIDVRYVAMVGMSLVACALLALSHIAVHGTYLHSLFPGLMLMSIGLGLTFVPLTLIATTNVTDADAGTASGLLNTSQQIGGAVGLAALATFANTRSQSLLHSGAGVASAVVQGYQTAFVDGAWMLVGGVVLMVLLVRSRDVRLVNGTNEDTVVPAA